MLTTFAYEGEAATAPNLGTAGSFAILAGSGISDDGTSSINGGDVGLSPTTGAAITGLTCLEVNGTIYDTNGGYTGGGDVDTSCLTTDAGLLTNAKTDLTTAYNNAAGQTPTEIGTELAGTPILPGTYDSASGTFGITGTLTLDADNDPNAVFIFQTGTTLVTGVSSSVVLINGAQACNVFWQIGSSATLGTSSSFAGTILASESISLSAGASVNGRLLASTGAVTLLGNSITASTCDVATSTPVPDNTSTPVPDNTSTPVPDNTSTPVPDNTSTPIPDNTSTPVPDSTSTPIPDNTSTPVPDNTGTPIPNNTSTPMPNNTSTPIPAATATQIAAATATQAAVATATQAAVATATQAAVATATQAAAATATSVASTPVTQAAVSTATPRATATRTAPANTPTATTTARETAVSSEAPGTPSTGIGVVPNTGAQPPQAPVEGFTPPTAGTGGLLPQSQTGNDAATVAAAALVLAIAAGAVLHARRRES